MYRITYTRQAAKDIKNLKACGLDKKARELIEIMKKNPFQNPPAYEKLVGNLQGYCSRRINIQQRIVFQVIEEPNTQEDMDYEGYVKIIRMWTHYEK
ncbi:MAG: Txe/YoeB family addiction module toxin [Lachnospiraceae bacterium]|nr:Txe/YoeB family addiction module toxin [Lachnospiraceae bacterium]